MPTYQMPNQRPGYDAPKPERRHANHEARLQIACVRWFRMQYPALVRLLYAVPNQGFRDKKEAAALKLAGVTPGVPDLHLAISRSGYHSLYVELKWEDNDLSDHQRQQMVVLQGEGHLVRVVRTIDEFMNLIRAYLSGQPLEQLSPAELPPPPKVSRKKVPTGKQGRFF